ncbi:MAG: hydrogenase maturation protease [Pseudomonadota bacterium]
MDSTKENDNNTSPPLPAHLACRVLVLGVGNRLYGDDGFGPRVVERLKEHAALPEEVCLSGDVCLIDAGTSAAGILFDLALAEEKTRPVLLLLIDAVDLPKKKHQPGDLWEMTPADLPANKRDDFSLHQLPGSDLLAELDRAGCRVRIIACQIKEIPDRMREGLSAEVDLALEGAAEMVMKRACE